ncbi:MAG: P-type conjugative transfer protein TrbJ [Azospirillum sp.]|nr:P-type conjugative transfer protein TrbJ [Azospirillum sp.]
MKRAHLVVLAAALVLGAGLLAPPAAALTVFDPSNYAENLVQSARALEQIGNQIRSLQNEATMLQNMALNLQPLTTSPVGGMTAALQRIGGLMQQAEGIAYQAGATETAIQQHYSDQTDRPATTASAVTEASARWGQAMDSYRDTLRLQTQVVENVAADGGTLGQVMASSQGAAGSLQAQQATNQLLALCLKQQLQIQTLMAAQDRAQTLALARRDQEEADARAATARFLGSGHAYSQN